MNKTTSVDQKPAERRIKVIVIGERQVGKTELIQQYFMQIYGYRNQQIGIDFLVIQRKINDIDCKFMIWDQSGSEKFLRFTLPYVRGSSGLILMYQIDEKHTFEKIQNLNQQFNQLLAGNNIPRILIGMKSDLESNREVSRIEGEGLAQKIGCKFFECSSKEGKSVSEAFEQMFSESFEYDCQINSLPQQQIQPTKQNNKCCIM